MFSCCDYVDYKTHLVNKFLAQNPMFVNTRMPLWCLFLDPHLTMHRMCIFGACLINNVGGVLSGPFS